MESLWFWLVSAMIAAYVVLDGFDLGAGVVHLFLAKTEEERKVLLRSIGPVWDGNEVWLLAGAGTLYFAFPRVYASSFSGFYLPLMLVLWLLVARAVALEFRNKIEGPAWRPFWDRVFGVSSLLLCVFLGAALGNVVRGVPLDGEGRFFEPLWTDFALGPETGVLDWYTVLAGVVALAALFLHGALWVAHKAEGDLAARCRRFAGRAWPAVGALTAVLTLFTFLVQPHVPARLVGAPWGFLFPALALAGLFLAVHRSRRGRDRAAFLGSCAYLAGMMLSAVFGLYPYLLPARGGPELGLTVHNSAAGEYGLRVGLAWWIPGVTMAGLYTAVVYRRFAGKVRLDDDGY